MVCPCRNSLTVLHHLSQEKHGITGTLSLRSNGGLKTNCQKPSKIRDAITDICGTTRKSSYYLGSRFTIYNALWILSGKNELIHEAFT